MPTQLPVEAYQKTFFDLDPHTNVVITAPTGTGKSTILPLWLQQLHGTVLVIEPRRIACQTLSDRVKQLAPNHKVGYTIRGRSNATAETQIHFVTPGIALQMLSTSLIQKTFDYYGAIMLDEFHQRSWEVDLIVALLKQAPNSRRILITSATLAAESISLFLQAKQLNIQADWWPVTISYWEHNTALPSKSLVEERLTAIWNKAESKANTGSILIFLPGLASINKMRIKLAEFTERPIVRLHSQLSQAEIDSAFIPGPKVILATNIAESSLTIPDIQVVIDSGLTKEVRYQNGHAVLTTVAITQDSATQRTGRAGRTQAGHCYRLWGRQAELEPHLSPEIQRIDLHDCAYRLFRLGYDPTHVSYFEPPRSFALKEAINALESWGVITPKTHEVNLPDWTQDLPVPLNLLRLFSYSEPNWQAYALAACALLEHRHRPLPPNSSLALQEARQQSLGLTNLLQNIQILERPEQTGFGIQQDRYARVLASWHELNRAELKLSLPVAPTSQINWVKLIEQLPYLVYGQRTKRRAWTNDKREVLLQDESFPEDKFKFCLILDYHVLEGRGRQVKLVSDALLPLDNKYVEQSSLGEWSLHSVSQDKDYLIGNFHRRFRGHKLEEQSRVLEGIELTQGVLLGIEQKQLFPRLIERQQDELNLGLIEGIITEETDAMSLVRENILALNLEEALEFSLLSETELVTTFVTDPYTRKQLNSEFPRYLEAQGAQFRIELYPLKKEAHFIWVSGNKNKTIPGFKIPKLRGWKLWHIERGKKRRIRG